jgi:ketosteroid isomerase-like protein
VREHPNATLVRDLFAAFERADLATVQANDRHAVALFHGRAEREGKALDNPTCLRMRIEDGQVAEVRELVWDLYHVDDFWA